MEAANAAGGVRVRTGHPHHPAKPGEPRQHEPSGFERRAVGVNERIADPSGLPQARQASSTAHVCIDDAADRSSQSRQAWFQRLSTLALVVEVLVIVVFDAPTLATVRWSADDGQQPWRSAATILSARGLLAALGRARSCPSSECVRRGRA